jgi:hypothetical protein
VHTTDRLGADLKRGLTASNERDLARYIAVSAILHAGDGWSYLGNAVLAMLKGDPHRAQHLAYYAELRAAMSLLATQGVGVFKNQHLVIGAKNKVTKVVNGGRTHDFSWDALEVWSHKQDSAALFRNIVRPQGITLEEWLHPGGGGAAVAARARDWLRQWGMDLRIARDDRDERNESSYRPDGVPDAWSINASDTLKFIDDVWSSCEPGSTSRFETIDRHILRIAVESLYYARTGNKASGADSGFVQHVDKIVRAQSLSPPISAEWNKFLLRQKEAVDLTVLQWSAVDPPAPGNRHLGTFSRATLLLRVASGATVQLFKAAGIDGNKVGFWWEEVGTSRGFWEGSFPFTELVDLWADVDPALKNLRAFASTVSANDQSFFKVGTALGSNLPALGSCERIGLWSLTGS